MKHNPFEIITQWLSKNSMTAVEKNRLRSVLVSYTTNHPVRSGLLSPYTFRYGMVALASLVLVLGGSIGITTASSQALPNQPLYAVKLWVEEFNARNQKTPEAIIAFETDRIETRFNEATRLAINQELDETTSAIVQGGLKHSREIIKTTANTIQQENPELALSATNVLETTFSSNGKILASIEKNTNQNIGSIVLAAQVTTKDLAQEKEKFEQIVALKPNTIDAKTLAEKKFAELEARMPADTQGTDLLPVSQVIELVDPTTITSTPPTFLGLAKEKIADGLYNEALVLLQKAEQILDEKKLTKELEETYQVKTEEQTPPAEIKAEPLEIKPDATTTPAVPLPEIQTSTSDITGTTLI